MSSSTEKPKLSQADQKKGCMGCLAIIGIIVVIMMFLAYGSNDDCIQLNGKWYCGPKGDVQNINRMDNANQSKAGQAIDTREAQENHNN